MTAVLPDQFQDRLLPDQFKSAFRSHPAGVAIITADDGGQAVGLTATSVISVSAEPALLAFSRSAQSASSPRIARAASEVVHLLTAGQLELARIFATGGIDKFAAAGNWGRLPTGEPVLLGVETWLRGRIAERIVVADSTVIVAEILEVTSAEGTSPPLVFRNRAWYSLDEASVVA